MTKYHLYRFRNRFTARPESMAKIHIGKRHNFLLMEREATHDEYRQCDLEYVGHNMDARTVDVEIKRNDH